MNEKLKRLRGLRALVEEAVEHGSKAVERVHRATAARPFRILEAVPVIAAPVMVVRVVHDLSLTTVYGSIRLVNKAVAVAVETALDVVESADEEARS